MSCRVEADVVAAARTEFPAPADRRLAAAAPGEEARRFP